MLTTAADGALTDGRRVFRPDEGSRVTIPRLDVGLDVADESPDGVERAAPDRLAGQDAEPRLDQVQPGRAFRREVKLDRGMLGEPGLHRWGRARGRVVEDDVQRPPAVTPGEPLHEVQEVGAGVSWRAAADDTAAGDFEGRIQTREPVAAIVVGLPGRQPRSQRQQRLGATET